MKKHLVAIAIALVLSGCSMFQSSPYDSNEYSIFIQLLTSSERVVEACDLPDQAQQTTLLQFASQMDAELHFLQNYANYRRTDNTSTVEITKIVRDTVDELRARYEGGVPSTAYCKAKINIIITQAKAGAEAVQQKIKE